MFKVNIYLNIFFQSHALSLRRAVQGRRLPFDELLKEHREAKEAYMKARVESKEAAAALKAASTPHKTGPSSSPGGKTPPYSQQSSPVLKSPSDINLKDNKSHSIAGFSSSTKLSQHFNRYVEGDHMTLSLGKGTSWHF